MFQVFSDESLRRPRVRFTPQPQSIPDFSERGRGRGERGGGEGEEERDRDWYQQLVASRSSLDDSTLQLAAERQDDWEAGPGAGYSTGSLRSSRRSLKMRNLMEMFEKGSGSSDDSNTVEFGAKIIKVGKPRSDSGSTTVSFGSQDLQETDDDETLFLPPPSPQMKAALVSPRSRSPAGSPRSRSRERMERDSGGGYCPQSPSTTRRRTSHSPSGQDPVSLRRRKPSPVNRSQSNVEDRRRGEEKCEEGVRGGVGSGRPPRYRSSSRGRAHSDSSTSESDHPESRGFESSRPRGLPRGRPTVEIIHDRDRQRTEPQSDKAKESSNQTSIRERTDVRTDRGRETSNQTSSTIRETSDFGTDKGREMSNQTSAFTDRQKQSSSLYLKVQYSPSRF